MHLETWLDGSLKVRVASFGWTLTLRTSGIKQIPKMDYILQEDQYSETKGNSSTRSEWFAIASAAVLTFSNEICSISYTQDSHNP
mgnify:CR=1 FL=1